MAGNRGLTFPVISSGSVVSEAFAIRGAGPLGIWAPVITSANVLFQVGFNSVSGQMVRAHRQSLGPTDVTSTWIWAAGAGSSAIMASHIGEAFPFARIETGVAQTDTRTFAVTQKV